MSCLQGSRHLQATVGSRFDRLIPIRYINAQTVERHNTRSTKMKTRQCIWGGGKRRKHQSRNGRDSSSGPARESVTKADEIWTSSPVTGQLKRRPEKWGGAS